MNTRQNLQVMERLVKLFFHPPVISIFLEVFSWVIVIQAPPLTLHTALPTHKLCRVPSLPQSTTTCKNTVTLEKCQLKLLLRPVPLPTSHLIPTLTSVRNDVTFKSGTGEIRKYVYLVLG
jgi:hypothetical protein